MAKSEIAVAWEQWRESDEGKSCRKDSASGEYLENRLWRAFMAGAAVPVSEEWISVQDRLPELSTEVLATGFTYGRDSGERFYAVAVCEKSGWWQFDHEADEYCAELAKPTHWQEIDTVPPTPSAGKDSLK